MKSLGHLKSYEIKLTVQSPLFIGSGQSLSKKEFIFNPIQNKAILMDFDKLVLFLTKKRLLEKFQYFLLDDRQRNLYYFFKDNNIKPIDYKYFSTYTINTVGDKLQETGKVRDLQLFIKDVQNKPYIPGSSLKGAFRTAWLAYLLENEDIDTKDSRYTTWSNDLSNCRGERDIKKISKNTIERLEQDYFNILKYNRDKPKNMVNSIMRGISFSDSTPMESTQLMLSQKIDIDLQGKEHFLPLLRECLKPGASCKFILTLDEVMLKDTGIDINQILHILQWFTQYQITHFYKKFKGQLTLPVNTPQTVIWLGGGVGFVNKTINDSALGDENALEYNSMLLNKLFDKKHCHLNDVNKGVSPHMEKIGTYQNANYVMGQCKLEVLKDK